MGSCIGLLLLLFNSPDVQLAAFNSELHEIKQEMRDEMTLNQLVSPGDLCHHQKIKLTWLKQHNLYAKHNSNG